MNVSHKKLSQLLKFWNLENEPVSDIYCEGNGEKSDSAVYAGDNYVLKFSADLGKVKNAITLCRMIEGAGIKASSLVMTIDGREYVQDGALFFYVTRRIDGAQMISRNFYKEDYVEQARFVGEIIGRLHRVLCGIEAPVNDVNIYETVKNWAMPKVRNILKLSDAFCREYLDAFGNLYDSLPKQIIHRDLNPSNIIVTQDGWGFIDFELSERSLRIYDPCYAATAILSETFDQSDPVQLDKWLEIYRNIIRGYDSQVHLTDEERKALPYVVMANQLICTAWFSGQEKFAEIFETNKCMTAWLVTVFDKLKYL